MIKTEQRERAEQCLKDYGEAVDILLAKADAVGSEKARQILLRLKERLRQGPVRLLVLGTSSSGKSTIVNALAEDIVAPEGPWVTSSVPLWVMGRDPKADNNNNSIFDRLNTDGSSISINQPDALSKFCHVPPTNDLKGKNEMEDFLNSLKDCSALLCKTKGGFLWETGLTLVDTPGIGQGTDDTLRAEESIAQGAELLLIVNRKPAISNGIQGNDGDPEGAGETEAWESDKDFLQSLFPNGKRDLKLDMKNSLFLVGNQDPGGSGTEIGIGGSMKELVSKWNVSPQFYWVNVLMQRQNRSGYYEYTSWFPQGIDNDTRNNALPLMENSDKGGSQVFQKVRREERPVTEAVYELTKSFIEQKAEEAYKVQKRETEDEDWAQTARQLILNSAEETAKAASQEWANGDRLRKDLADRAQRFYEDFSLFCGPIEDALDSAVQEMIQKCNALIGRAEKKYLNKVKKREDAEFDSEELSRLRSELEAARTRQDRAAEAADAFEESTQASLVSIQRGISDVGRAKTELARTITALRDEAFRSFTVTRQELENGDFQAVLSRLFGCYQYFWQELRESICDHRLLSELFDWAGMEREKDEIGSQLEYLHKLADGASSPEADENTEELSAFRKKQTGDIRAFVEEKLPDGALMENDFYEKISPEITKIMETRREQFRNESLLARPINAARALVLDVDLKWPAYLFLGEEAKNVLAAYLEYVRSVSSELFAELLEKGKRCFEKVDEALSKASGDADDRLKKALKAARDADFKARVENDETLCGLRDWKKQLESFCDRGKETFGSALKTLSESTTTMDRTK